MKEEMFSPINEGYQANKEWHYFLGATPDLNFAGNVIVGLSNPFNSGVNLYVDLATICNLSKDLCRVEICNAYHTLDNLEKVERISMGNLNCNPCSVPKGSIYFGMNQRIPNEISWCTTTLDSYATLPLPENGMLIIAPGTSHYYIITPLMGLKKPTINMSFKWWEEKILE